MQPADSPPKNSRARRLTLSALMLAVLATSHLQAQNAPDNGPVTREEYNALKEQLKEVTKALAEMRQQRATAAPAGDVAAVHKEVAALRQQVSTQKADAEQSFNDVDEIIKDLKRHAAAQASGTTKLVLTGDAAFGFQGQRGTDSTFSAGVAPRLLWELTPQILVDAAFDASVSGTGKNSSTAIDLTIADISYLVNDYVVVGGGLFVIPFGQYHNHFDPPWINPMPDDPLVFSDGGLAPGSGLGAFVSGAVPIGSAKANYALFVSNGASLDTSNADTAGQLSFNNYSDVKSAKAVGGRIGFLPVPELEVGYSLEAGQVSPDHTSGTDFQSVNAWLHAVDFSYRKQFEPIMGTIHCRAEWIWSYVDSATYDPTGEQGFGPITFNNDRNGGYLMASYRPTLADNKIIRNFELVTRYDRMDASAEAPSGEREQRYAVGLDYWFDPRVVLKSSYEWDWKDHAEGANAFFVSVGVGF